MRYMIIIALLCAVLLVGCQPATPPDEPLPEPETPPEPEAPPEPEPEPTPDAAVDEVDSATVEVPSGLDAVFGPRDEEQVITVEDVLCDPENSKMTFRFRNLDDKIWQLDGEVPFPPPPGIDVVRVQMNNYGLNDGKMVLYRGEEYFGPNHKFSENCGGVAELAPGDEAECTVYPVILQVKTALSDGTNEIRINGPGADGIVRFACEDSANLVGQGLLWSD